MQLPLPTRSQVPSPADAMSDRMARLPNRDYSGQRRLAQAQQGVADTLVKGMTDIASRILEARSNNQYHDARLAATDAMTNTAQSLAAAQYEFDHLGVDDMSYEGAELNNLAPVLQDAKAAAYEAGRGHIHRSRRARKAYDDWFEAAWLEFQTMQENQAMAAWAKVAVDDAVRNGQRYVAANNLTGLEEHIQQMRSTRVMPEPMIRQYEEQWRAAIYTDRTASVARAFFEREGLEAAELFLSGARDDQVADDVAFYRQQLSDEQIQGVRDIIRSEDALRRERYFREGNEAFSSFHVGVHQGIESGAVTSLAQVLNADIFATYAQHPQAAKEADYWSRYFAALEKAQAEGTAAVAETDPEAIVNMVPARIRHQLIAMRADERYDDTSINRYLDSIGPEMEEVFQGQWVFIREIVENELLGKRRGEKGFSFGDNKVSRELVTALNDIRDIETLVEGDRALTRALNGYTRAQIEQMSDQVYNEVRRIMDNEMVTEQQTPAVIETVRQAARNIAGLVIQGQLESTFDPREQIEAMEGDPIVFDLLPDRTRRIDDTEAMIARIDAGQYTGVTRQNVKELQAFQEHAADAVKEITGRDTLGRLFMRPNGMPAWEIPVRQSDYAYRNPKGDTVVMLSLGWNRQLKRAQLETYVNIDGQEHFIPVTDVMVASSLAEVFMKPLTQVREENPPPPTVGEGMSETTEQLGELFDPFSFIE